MSEPIILSNIIFTHILTPLVYNIINILSNVLIEFFTSFIHAMYIFFRSVTSLDCVRFQSMLSNYSSVDYVHRSSGWLLLDAAETLFATAKRRLFNSKKGIFLRLRYLNNCFN